MIDRHDNDIAAALLDAKGRGVHVRIISDNDKLFDRGSDVQKLMEAGIPTVLDKTDHHMHHKFAIIDKKVVICGSYNWTRSAATRNNEDIVVQDTPIIVRGFIAEFNRLWQEFSSAES